MIASRTWRAGLVVIAVVAASVQWSAPAVAGGYSAQRSGEVGAAAPAVADPSALVTGFAPLPPTDSPTPPDPSFPVDPTPPVDPSNPVGLSSPPDSSTPAPSSTPPDSSTPAPSSTPPDSSTPAPSSTPPDSSTPAPSSTPPDSSMPAPSSTPPDTGTDPAPTPTGAPPTHPTSTGGPSGGSIGGGPHSKPPPKKTPRVVRPHPHKTLRPKAPAVAPGARRPHPHRKPWPITLTIKTVPALAGARFTVDGHPLVTRSDGVTTYTAEHDFAAHRLSVVSNSVTTAAKRFQFNRWAGQRDPNQAFSRTVSGLPLRSNYIVTAAFTVQEQVIPRLVRQDGVTLDPTEVDSITARSDSGAIVNLPLTSPTWLDGIRPSFHHSVLSAEPVSYSLQSVIVRGTNVVDAGRQVFRPATTNTPVFTTQFHDLVITGHDALFKSGLGTSATVTFPDGGKLTVRLNSQHTATLTNLPRGTYRVTIQAGRAIVGTEQFGLSKDKTADLVVISALDLAILAGVLLIIAFALLAIGRQYWRRLLSRPRRAPGAWLPREKILT